ncbi:Linear gramicidin synthase subunit D [Choanephora cucurbitarum]|uniref:Linear gramicidin synthase subunit D n=1 Tax=Choanephora cucurbitarum TaxID=101091 RepID=A0A1C7NJM0_9FUNG|nr:Linear gramicidin synthase subunit D [Choanephora cucurbitarum]
MAPVLINPSETLEGCSVTIPDEPQRYFKYLTFSNFLTSKFEEYKDNICVRSYTKSGQIEVMTYKQVDGFTSRLAYHLYNDIKNKHDIQLGKGTTVAIFNTHSVSSFFLIIALVKLKCKMLMISSRNSPDAAKSLIEKTGCCLSFTGSLFINSISIVPVVPFPSPNYHELLAQPDRISEEELEFIQRYSVHKEEELNDIVMIVHSSGTTAFPKPIQLSNRFMLFLTQALTANFSARGYEQLCLKETNQVVCLFPIFHIGGICSSFRAIVCGGSHVYLHQYPPSINEVVQCLKQGQEQICMTPLPLVESFMDYVTQTNESELLKSKIAYLETGGNPIPLHVANWYQKHGYVLGVAYGSSESLPMMTNNYLLDSIDHNILFLMPSLKPHVYMEPYDSERFQLIIKASSPYRASGIANRDNGDFTTKDLFFKSKYVDGFYYSGRSDDTLAMSNGEKTNPVPMELAIKECPFVLNCLVIGESRPCTALLLELDPSQTSGRSQEEIMESVNKFVAIANQSAPNFSTILPQMIAVLPNNQPFPTTDKGSISRSKTSLAFKDLIEKLYENWSEEKVDNRQPGYMTEDDAKQKLYDIVVPILNASFIDSEVSLFSQGLTSLNAIQLRNSIAREIKSVPQDFVYDNDTICSMAVALVAKEGIQKKDKIDTGSILESFVQRANEDISHGKKHTILLTGATGSLGAYLLRDLLLDSDHVKKVYVLVRQNGHQTSLERIIDSFERRKINTALLSDPSRLEILCINNEKKEHLGLCSKESYDQLRSEVTLIQACGWMLDFYKTVQHYEKDCLDDFYSLIQFAHQNQQNPIPLHYISSISASALYGSVVPEVPMPSDSPQVALPFGYGQSKYIAEKLLDYLREEKNKPCYIYRVGQLCGDSIHGVWNTSELASSILMSGILHLKQMPDLKSQINWIPVDYASKTIHQLMVKAHETNCKQTQHIFHIVHPHTTSWSALFQTLQKAGFEFDIVPIEAWIDKVNEQGEINPVYRFLDLFKTERGIPLGSNTVYETIQTAKLAPVLLDTPELDADLVKRWFHHWARQ